MTSDQRATERQKRLQWFKTEVLCHEAELRRQLRRSSLAPADIDDLVAECLARVYSVERPQEIGNARSYLFKVCRNIQLDQARRARVVAFDSITDLDTLRLSDQSPSPDALLGARDDLRVLQRAIDRLPARCREIFLLRRVHELSLAEIAVRLGISVKTVENQMTKALAALTAILAEVDPSNSFSTVVAWRRKQTS